jgi:MFS family permease
MAKRAPASRSYFLRDIKPVIRLLIISDIALVGSGGLLGPVFAIFIEDFIIGGTVAVAGMAAGIFLFTKSLLQIPIAHFIDRVRGEKDDFWLLFTFSLLMALMPILYLYISTPLQLYAVQFVYGLVTAFTFPSFMSIFTHHIDTGKEGTEWGVYFTLTDLTSALLAALGGYIAATHGFTTLISIVVILSLLGALLLYPIRPYLKRR